MNIFDIIGASRRNVKKKAVVGAGITTPSAQTVASPTLATLSLMNRNVRASRPPQTLAPAEFFEDSSSERRLVEELFTSPRSLAAAFIVSEVLQPPLALRPPR